MRASFSAGGTSAAAMRCASPSTMAVFPTPALPINAGLFLLWRSRMSTARAISGSRQRTGPKSPRRADRIRQGEPRGGAEHRVLEPGHSRRERGAEPDDEPGPVVFVGYEIMAGVGDGDPEEDRREQRGGEEMHGRPVDDHRRNPQ